MVDIQKTNGTSSGTPSNIFTFDVEKPEKSLIPIRVDMMDPETARMYGNSKFQVAPFLIKIIVYTFFWTLVTDLKSDFQKFYAFNIFSSGSTCFYIVNNRPTDPILMATDGVIRGTYDIFVVQRFAVVQRFVVVHLHNDCDG